MNEKPDVTSAPTNCSARGCDDVERVGPLGRSWTLDYSVGHYDGRILALEDLQKLLVKHQGEQAPARNTALSGAEKER